MNILKPIYEHEKERAAAKAGDTLITYGRLCADLDSMAHWLLGQGLEPGDRISIHGINLASPNYWDLVMNLGAIRAGLASSAGLLPPAVAQSGALGPHAAALGKLDKLPEDTAPKVKLPFAPTGTEPLAEQFDIKAGKRKLDKLEEQAKRLMKTSGTTGTPKVIVWDSKILEGRLGQLTAANVIDADTKLFTALGMATTTGLRYPLGCWQIGGFVILSGIGEETSDIKQMVETSTFIAASPFRLQQLLRQVPGEWAGKEARTIDALGGRVPPAMREAALQRSCSAMLISYGATEAGLIAVGDASLIERDAGAVGTLQPGVTVEIVDKELNALPHGKEGIVRIKTDCMCHSYAGEPEDSGNRSPLKDGWFYPGDIGVLYEDSLFAVKGRLTETINVSGAKFSPLVLEERLSKLPAVKDVCVMSLPLNRGDVLCAAVVCPDNVNMKILRQNVAKLMPKKFPLMVVRLKEIPRNAMGRIPRQRLTQAMVEQVRKNRAQRQAAAQADA